MLPKKVLLVALTAILCANVARSADPVDTLVLNRVFRYEQRYVNDTIAGLSTNLYVKYHYQTHKRNATLWVIPTLYSIASGRRQFVSEQYSRLTFLDDIDHYETRNQVYYTTIPHNRRTMTPVLKFLTPNLYAPTMYGDHVLSPFHRDNRIFYRYTTHQLPHGLTRLYFRPRHVNNTQLVQGRATIDSATGRIIDVELQGEYDMLRFHTLSMQGNSGTKSLLPKLCQTNVEFKFLGNHITTNFEAVFDCPITLPDSVNVKGNRELIDSVRPITLTPEEEAAYAALIPPVDTLALDDSERPHRHNLLKEVGWDLIGENLLQSLRTQSENGYVKLSPIINPQYLSYSKRKGFSYKLKLGAQYNFTPDVYLKLNPQVGYNFKHHKFYANIPLQFNYTVAGRPANATVEWGVGNRIANSSVADHIRSQQGQQDQALAEGLEMFDDHYQHLSNTVAISPSVSVEAGLIYHQRRAVRPTVMRTLGMPATYRSFAPTFCLRLHPWSRGPHFTIDYERGAKLSHSFLTYERWELDASLKHRMSRMQTLNLRVGGGLYTNRANNYFMDYSNFRDENLPEGWDDDWSGNFQLISTQFYNASRYYLRGNVSFESPLLGVSYVPLVGRFVECERAYLSTIALAHTRLYSELGYGFSCRVFSMGFFASFLGLDYQEMGCKFTFELFRRW
ncbi:MAG: DUF5686 family protein [Prevotella sp.]|nr:DUF5686 family protein [Prevotella sp.]